jgi:hypothetical protein
MLFIDCETFRRARVRARRGEWMRARVTGRLVNADGDVVIA